MFDAAGWRCESCGRAGRLELDHKRPVHDGGDWWGAHNLQVLCRGCHIEKSRREAEVPLPGRGEWDAYIAGLQDMG